MYVGLHDAELDYLRGKSFPNLAIMKLSAWHKAAGDRVEWWNALTDYDLVYSSKVLSFTPVNEYLPTDAICGGTGYKDVPLDKTLPEEVDACFPDYSMYPTCDYAVGFLTRGCPNHCRWCLVPKKEGGIRPYRKWQEIARPDANKLVLMDNNILAAGSYGLGQLEELGASEYKIDLNQGMDARLVDDATAKILAQVKWIRYLRFSCDQKSQIDPITNAVELLGKYGVKPYRIFIYMLVTADIEDASYRVEALKQYPGINLFAMAERNDRYGIFPNHAQLEFQRRYIYSGIYRQETWQQYCEKRGFVY